MAFTANSDLNVLQASDSANVGADAGNDVYVLTNGLLSDNQQVQIIDSGDNTIRLTSGLEIASSQVISNGFVLTLANGAEITILESSGYTFEVGGDALTGQGATVQNFTQFVTQTLGLSEVPAVGDVVNGGALTVGGVATAEPDNVFVLTEMAESSRLIDGLDFSNVQDYSGFDASLIIKEKLAPVLTTDQKNDGVVGDGLANEGNDLILTDAYGLHGAIVNAGAGENELRIDMKGPFAQPTLLQNIQTVKVTNLENAYDGTRDAWMSIDDAGGINSTLDLSRAIDIENLIVNEGTAPGGSLTVWNIQNGAAVTLEGSFSEAVTLDFAGGLDAVNLTLDNVRDNGGNGFDLNLAHNAGQVNLVSEGRLNVIDASELGADLDTLNISGNAKLVLQADLEFRDDLAITVDASLSTGGVDLEVDLAENETGVVNLMGGSGNDSFEIKGNAEVGDSDTNAITLTADMGTGSNDTLILNSNNTAATLRVLDGSSIDGNNVTLRVKNDVDISEANDLFATDAGVTVAIDNGETIILNQAQYDTIGTANFEVASVSANANGTIALQVADNFDVDTIDAAGLADGLTLGLNIADGVVLDITGDQLVNLVTNGVTFDGEGTLNVTGLTQANVTALEDWANEAGVALNFTGQPAGTPGVIITNGSATTVNMTLAEDVAFTDDNGTGATALGAVEFELDGNTLTLKASTQAHDLTVNNGEINLEFIGTAGVSLDMGDYTNITNITVWDALVNNNPNIENLFSDLSTSLNVPADQLLENIINIIATPADQLTPDRIVVIHEDVTRDGDLVFVTEDAATNNDNVQNVTVSLEGGSTLDGDIVLDRNTTKNGSLQTLTINSNGSDANTITGDIVGDDNASGHGGGIAQNGVLVGSIGENDLLDVTINATADLAVEGTIVFSSQTANASATLTVTGSADVTLKALDTTDASVTGLTVDTTGYTGTLTITGGSDALELDNTETLTFVGDGDIVLDTTDSDENDPAVDDNSGIEGDALTSIDASALTGSLTVGVLEDVDEENFTFTGAQGTTTLTLGGPETTVELDADGSADELGWTFNLNAADTLTITDNVDFTAGPLTITNGTVVIEGIVDLTNLVDDNGTPGDATDDSSQLTLGDDVVLSVAANSALKMTDLQWNSLTTTQQNAITGTGLVLDLTDQDTLDALNIDPTDDTAIIDLSEFRGVTEVIISEDATADFRMTADQAAVAYTVDANGDRSTWDHDGDGATAEVDRVSGDLRELNDNTSGAQVVTVEVREDADVSDLALDSHHIIELPNDTVAADQADLTVTIDEDHVALLDTAAGGANEQAVLDQLASLTVNVEVDTGTTDINGDPLITDSSLTITNDGTDISVSGNAAAIGTLQGGDIDGYLSLATGGIEWTAVGSTPSMKLEDAATADLTAVTGVDDTFVFAASVDTDPSSALVIASFSDGNDILDFSAWATGAAGTLAVDSVTNAAADNSFTVDAANTTIYVIDTDANDLGNVAGSAITDFTDMSVVAAFLDDGVTTNNTADEEHYFIINDGDNVGDAYLYQFVDDAGDTAVDAAELTLIAVIGSDAVIAANDMTIA